MTTERHAGVEALLMAVPCASEMALCASVLRPTGCSARLVFLPTMLATASSTFVW